MSTTRTTGPCSECGRIRALWQPCDRTYRVTIWHTHPDTGDECPGSCKAPAKTLDGGAAAS